MVVADRGFLIEEVALHGETLTIPAFTKGKQLPQKNVELLRQMCVFMWSMLLDS